MKKITIIGDSYGCGEWLPNNRPQCNYKNIISGHEMLMCESHPGIEFYLDEMGYAVVTIANGYNSNLQQLHLLGGSLMLRYPRIAGRFFNPNYIIWFFTDTIRDIERYLNDDTLNNEDKVNLQKIYNESKSYSEMNEKIVDYTLKQAENIYQITNIPFIIIEGLGSTLGIEKKYNFCIKNYKNWVSVILDSNFNLPLIASVNAFNSCEKSLLKNFSLIELNKIMDDCYLFFEKISKSDFFPDNGHPNRVKHKELAIEIDKYIKDIK